MSYKKNVLKLGPKLVMSHLVVRQDWFQNTLTLPLTINNNINKFTRLSVVFFFYGFLFFRSLGFSNFAHRDNSMKWAKEYRKSVHSCVPVVHSIQDHVIRNMLMFLDEPMTHTHITKNNKQTTWITWMIFMNGISSTNYRLEDWT